jgi:hypothetical protein
MSGLATGPLTRRESTEETVRRALRTLFAFTDLRGRGWSSPACREEFTNFFLADIEY